MNVATYMAKRYSSPPCWQLVADVYINELGEQVDVYATVTDSVRAAARAFRLQLHKGVTGFGQIEAPVDFAVVLMGKTRRAGVHHCGVFCEGKVLHALDTGTLHQDLASLQDEYPLMEYWSR